ncbi:MAG: sugar transferase, partial [Gammaproteobacteria bacterium]|nr:sugar transferase [Gammaproteobacteria bacterium]
MVKKGLLKGHSNTLNYILRFIDLLVVLACGVLSYYYSSAFDTYTATGVHGLPGHYLKVILLAVVLTVLLFPLFNVYRVWRGSSTLTEIKYLTMAWLMVGLLLSGLAFVTKSGADFSRHWMGLWFASTWISLVGSRALLRIVLHWLRSSGFNHRHIVIVGTGEQAVVVADRLRRSTWFGLEISALFGTDSENLPSWLKNIKIISDVTALREYVDGGGVDQVWISLPHSEEVTIREVITALDGSAAEIRYVPDIFEYQLMHHSLTEIAGVPVVNISYSAINGMNKGVKAVEDIALVMVLLVMASPVMLLIAAGVKLSSPGPVFYRQRRVGWNGVEFTMYKFRSMPVEAEEKSGPVWASKVDNR